ncbi:adenine nucleotide transporter BT1, chloroplastic/mitochondrial-like [Nymphaea colorata]|nr:adenine nucleotide transporter BT1, chloroplastic/mitochondrial-like [Nymphaea colorata]
MGCWDTGVLGKKGKRCIFSASEVVSPWNSIDGILQNWNKMENKVTVPNPDVGFQWNGFFASVGQMGMDVGGPSNPREDVKRQIQAGLLEPESSGSSSTNAVLEHGLRMIGIREKEEEGKANDGVKVKIKKRNVFRVTIRNASLRRLISGAVAGAVSRTAVAPLETIRTHLMVGSSGNSTTEVFRNIMETEGWKGLFRGNFVNVIRVAPSKAIELFAYDTVRKHLSPKPGESPRVPVPASLVAGAIAGISSTLCTYPLELVKTRITIQRGIYNNTLHAFLKIVEEEGPGGLYRGLTPSLIGVVPYAATNYFVYDTLRKAYGKVFKTEEIGNVATLLIGSAAGAISSSATFPLEVARKNMQVGAVSGRQVYRNMLHALTSILEKEGISGLYVGLGPSCMKLVPAAGISFMCYEACKRILVDKQDDE